MEKYSAPIDLDHVPDPEGFLQKMQRIHSDGTVQLSLDSEKTKILVGFNPVIPFRTRLGVLMFISGASRCPGLQWI